MDFACRFVPWVGTLAIVLNIYNGDILGIPTNLEYVLWHAIPLGLQLLRSPTKATLAAHHVLVMGVGCNLFWFYESPFRPNRLIRHRTEYYDTQCLLCAMLYHACYEHIYRPLTSS